ncbi:hypothetical protein, partial [Variovorax ginsengisoli]
QAIAGASYQYSPTTSLKFGYRYLSYKRDNGLLDKVAMSAPGSGSEDRMATLAPQRFHGGEARQVRRAMAQGDGPVGYSPPRRGALTTLTDCTCSTAK